MTEKSRQTKSKSTFSQKGAIQFLPVLILALLLVALVIGVNHLNRKQDVRSNAAASPGVWTNVTSNLANMASQCGNLTMLSAVPNSNTIIAGVALDGLWASNNNGASWSQLGTGSGSATIVNRPSWISYDPTGATTFWESGIYNSGGAYKTTNSGSTFQQLGSVTHDDFISVDFTDPNRQTLLVGGHEQSQSVWKSTDGGQTWTNIGLNLPSGTGFSSDPVVINAQTFIVNTDTSWGGGSPGIYRTTDGGTTWTQVSSVDPSGPPLVASDGTIYWSSGGSLVKSSDQGVTWTLVGSGLTGAIHPIELPNGNLVSVSGTSLVASSDGGSTWSPIGPTMPYIPAGVIYSPQDQAFYIWHWDCGNVVLPDAIEELSYSFGSTSPSPTSIPTPSPTAMPTSSPTPAPTTLPQTGSLSLVPESQSAAFNSTVTMQLQENSGSTAVNAVQTVITYPTNLLQLTSIDDSTTPSPFTLVTQETNTNGTITIAKGATTAQTGDQVLTTLHFKAIGSGTANVAINGSPQSQIVASSPNQNILGTTTPASVSVGKIGDFNNDGAVNIIDFSIFLSNWQTANPLTDLNNDGITNILDFSIFLSNWGT